MEQGNIGNSSTSDIMFDSLPLGCTWDKNAMRANAVHEKVGCVHDTAAKNIFGKLRLVIWCRGEAMCCNVLKYLNQIGLANGKHAFIIYTSYDYQHYYSFSARIG